MSPRLFVLFQLLMVPSRSLLTPSTSHSSRRVAASRTTLNSHTSDKHNLVASTILATSLAIAASTPLPAQAYIPSDYASETVQTAIKTLKDASGNVDETFKAYEMIAGIITEGEGVGGMVNYKGIQLERGYISDEDTSVYNPGLTLLTESEKQRLVDAVIQARKDGLAKNQWSENNEFGYEFLKGNLDPLHMTELRGYLGFVPFYAAIIYAAVLGVQQFARGIFPAAYLIGVAAFALPIFALIAAGP
eukprot:CAMPEP_0117061000 /NCGR_PEP_ID=MMETSP0472-20121206/42437_1 /TAXON_ID=693140 ORGANISM="Tiarina fusus, Strain LIS" /NCGR_SAMPLE_ID=MMETSP0472 /ASSEMBLY_ACC=CAM_ASM_000603 /LENGTH=246 /DNA_ID=CAMNT_0004779445 /DNA_START=101 /DNA_END=841 /DNA_ORIENTATION=+